MVEHVHMYRCIDVYMCVYNIYVYIQECLRPYDPFKSKVLANSFLGIVCFAPEILL